MSRFKSYHVPGHLYFVTTTVVGRKRILTESPIARIVLASLQYLRRAGRMKLYTYVLMPDHLHLIILPLQPAETEQTISDLMRDFKKFTSKRIIEELRQTGNTALLDFFSRSAHGHKGQRHKVWQDGFFDENIYTREFLNQKVQYIHYNPVRKGMVADPEEYIYSSARRFVSGGEGALELDALGEYPLRDTIPKASISDDRLSEGAP
jgi:putative transposase